MSFAVPVVADSVAARAGVGAGKAAATKAAGGGATRAELGTYSKKLLGAGADRSTVHKALVERGSSASEAAAILDEVAPQPKPSAQAKNTPKRSARSSSTPSSSGRKPTDSTAPRRRSPAERSVSVPAPTLSPPRGASGWSSADGAGFLLGLVAFALGTSYLRYGPAGVRGWFSAKFVNKVDPAIAAGEAARGITPKARPTGGAA